MGKVLAGLTIIGIVIAGIVGWVMNIVQIVGLALADAPLNTLFVVKVIGVFLAPLGAVLGYIG